MMMVSLVANKNLDACFFFSFTARRVWKDYFPAVDAIVFLVAAFDTRAFLKAKMSFALCWLMSSWLNAPF